MKENKFIEIVLINLIKIYMWSRCKKIRFSAPQKGSHTQEFIYNGMILTVLTLPSRIQLACV